MSKNRVAPVKTVTLPRLELMGALIGARLAKHILGFIDTRNIYFWCDSQIVLSWMSSTKTLPLFVANRIKEIRKLVGNMDWRYCPTDQNPADCLTRGMTAKQLNKCTLWTRGPLWIDNQNNWPKWNRNIEECSAFSTITDEENVKQENTDKITSNKSEVLMDIEHFSSLTTLIRITAYALRFVHNSRSKLSDRKKGLLTVQELHDAKFVLIRNVQRTSFREEIDSVKSTKPKISIVRQLRLYIDENGLLRCGGRINNAPIDSSAKYPVLLPTKHHFTSLIVKDAHVQVLHGGPNCTIAHIQQNYWIPRIRHCVKFHLRKCVQCIKVMGKSYAAPDPPPLPKDRVNDERPFYVTGVDFTGAMCTKGPLNNNCKSYICLFTCAATRAVHLEIVPDLTEDSFLLAFRRFVARRSLPSVMISDNATTFKASAETIQQKLTRQGTEWKFIPNRAPWFGGWWERLIGLTKNILKKVLGKSFVTTDNLRTVVTEIESVMNNRPITYITTDNTDPQPLTPSHLLNGRRLDSLPYPIEDIQNHSMSLNHTKCNKHLERQQLLIEHFRARWRNEYLTSLREFHRASGNNLQTIQVGDVVQVHNDSSRITWKLAVVKELIRGNDGFTRSAIIKTDTGITNRPITKLYPLEVRDTNSETRYNLRSRPGDKL